MLITSHSTGNVCDAAEMAEVSKKKYKKKHTCSPNNIVGHCFGSFYVSNVMLGSGRSRESGGDMGDAAEVAELSKKKKYILGAQTMSNNVFWARFMFLM